MGMRKAFIFYEMRMKKYTIHGVSFWKSERVVTRVWMKSKEIKISIIFYVYK